MLSIYISEFVRNFYHSQLNLPKLLWPSEAVFSNTNEAHTAYFTVGKKYL